MTDQRRRRSTIRARLTMLYAGTFFLAGALLVALMYASLRGALDRQQTVRVGIAEEQLRVLVPGDASAVLRLGPMRDELRAQFKRDRDSTLQAMLAASLASLAIIGAGAGALGWALAGQALSPLRTITGTARRVADRSLHERIALVGPDDEIKDLADTLDAMLERLDRAFDSQRRFVANASHELRTPLAINRTLIEVALDDSQADERLRQLGTTLLSVNERHERLIDGLLTLASSEDRVSTAVAVDLADIARHVLGTARPAAEAAALELRTHLRSAPVNGDPVLLERLVQNVIDNAIRYNRPSGGWISVETGATAQNACLTVVNPGEPIADYDVPRLFEPFRRLPSTDRLATPASWAPGRGAGLGLSIVRSVAHAHGGFVAAQPNADGGLEVKVQLPLARTA